LSFKTSNKKRAPDSNDVIKIKKLTASYNDDHIRVFQIYIKTKILQLSITHQLSFNSIHYSSNIVKIKRCDACFISNDSQIGLIECFVVYSSNVFVIAKKIVPLFNCFYRPSCPEIKSSMHYCYISDQLFVIELKNITKTLLVHTSNDNCFVSLFHSSHLFSWLSIINSYSKLCFYIIKS
jgi:hypothetical protein